MEECFCTFTGKKLIKKTDDDNDDDHDLWYG